MTQLPVSNTRNVVILGHTGSGKTTLIDAILYKTGQNDRLGLTANGSSMADWTDEEKDRKISIWAKPFHVRYTTTEGQAMDLTLIDTPGYLDLFGQAVAASRVADAALIIIDAVSGIQVGSTRSWRLCEANNLPCGIVITGLDKENADFEKVLASIQAAWGKKCVPVELPTHDRHAIIDILAETAIPEELKDEAELAMNVLEEDAAEEDDVFLDKYLSGEHLTHDELTAGLRVAVKRRHIVPIFEAEALQNVGVSELLDELYRLFPSPLDVDAMDAEGREINPAADAPFCGLVWRAVNDPYMGQLQFLRVLGGTLAADSEVMNVTKNQKERIGPLHVYNGKKDETVAAVTAGQIVALAKLKNTGINDTLCASGSELTVAPISFPQPVMSVAVVPKTQGDDDKIGIGLHRVVEEDPTLHLERNTETHELILSGMGDIHLDIAVSRMKKRSNVDVELKVPKVAYKETITGRGEGHYKHKKQSGGRGQYGEVYLKVEPRDPSDAEWFVNEIVGGAIPRNFMPAVEKGVQEGLGRGVLAGFPLINVKIRVYDGTYHDVDSSEVAFKIAGARALSDGATKAKPVLLEPIMNLKITIPEQYMGDITGDLNHRRGRILGIEAEAGMQIITAEAPQAEIFRYAAELRSLTQGQGVFEAEFNRYDIVPNQIAQKVIASAVKQQHEDE
ncbi:MAG TPA: elongation factor G [Kiritimatiellia bacterium]|nr:elongation factor G [Kiritimatiellia bacterium]HMO99589.1 elongation factor G [Kiritimatiellia bacterium]HMP96022.1 elongation factor G [Kiritimatiellia bacterium]